MICLLKNILNKHKNSINNMDNYFEERNKWLTASDEIFLRDCKLDWFQASGPGGQKRNRKYSGVRLKHIPTDITVEVVKSRSQNENRHQAIKKLKLQIAIFTAGPVIDNFRVDVSISNSEYFINAAKVFDTLKKYNFSVSDTAKELNISTSRLIKFLARDEFLWREVNAERERLGMKKLKV
jgi:hypothetical protein